MFKHNNPKKVIISEYLLASEFFSNGRGPYFFVDHIAVILRRDFSGLASWSISAG